MNEQLRQFERESKLEILGLGARREIWERALEKYAELIVKECMANLYLNGYDDAMMQIKQHFGIKE
jgi:hypothetical protein